jgi:hypothetical protein
MAIKALDVKDKVVVVEIDDSQEGIDEFMKSPMAREMKKSLKASGAYSVIYKNRALDIAALSDKQLKNIGLRRIKP